MNNKVIVSDIKKIEKQNKFMQELEEAPRERAKTILLKQTDQAIEAIVELKADLVTNGITAHIYNFDFNDTDTFFKPLKDAIGYMDFIIDREVHRIIDISLMDTSDEIQRMEAKEKRELQEEADKIFFREVEEIQTEEGTIKIETIKRR